MTPEREDQYEDDRALGREDGADLSLALSPWISGQQVLLDDILCAHTKTPFLAI